MDRRLTTTQVSGRAMSICLLLLCAQAKAGDSFVDPTAPPAVVSPTPVQTERTAVVKHFSLGGIFVHGGDRHAVVNGKLLAIGDRVDGARLEDINDEGVVLNMAGSRVHLRLLPSARAQ